jgi:hypothetical protein
MSRSNAYDRESAETRGIDKIVCHFAASMLTGYGQDGCHGWRIAPTSGNRLAWDVLKQHHGHLANSSNGAECRTSHLCRQLHSGPSGMP